MLQGPTEFPSSKPLELVFPVPTGRALFLNTSCLALEAYLNQTAFHDQRDLAFSARMFKHGFELLWISHNIQIGDLLTRLSIGLPGRCREGSGVLSEDENLL